MPQQKTKMHLGILLGNSLADIWSKAQCSQSDPVPVHNTSQNALDAS